MLPASNRGAGMNMGFPDVCPTVVGPAVVPIPYPNIAMHAQAVPFAPTVLLGGMNALNEMSKIPLTSGDEAGTASPLIKGMGQFTMGAPNVLIEDLPAINLLCPTTGNMMNNPIGSVIVPGAVNVLINRAHATPHDAMELEELVGIRGDIRAGSREEVVDDVLVLALSGVDAEAVSRVRAAVDRASVRALVLDLRRNPGGELEAGLCLAEAFLPGGALLATLLEEDGDTQERRARAGHALLLPLVVLVDRGTASAAEVFAGIVQDHGRAIVVGARTYGKGTVERIAAGEGGRPVRVVAATVVLPSGAHVEGHGVVPDVELGGDTEDTDPLAIACITASMMADRRVAKTD